MSTPCLASRPSVGPSRACPSRAEWAATLLANLCSSRRVKTKFLKIGRKFVAECVMTPGNKETNILNYLFDLGISDRLESHFRAITVVNAIVTPLKHVFEVGFEAGKRVFLRRRLLCGCHELPIYCWRNSKKAGARIGVQDQGFNSVLIEDFVPRAEEVVKELTYLL